MQELSGDWLKIQRAKYHLQSLKTLFEGFAKGHPHEIGIRFVGEGQERKGVAFFKNVMSLPPELSTIVGDICQNARSALDHLMFRLCIANDSSFANSAKAGHIYFPIYNDAARLNSDREALRRLVGDDAWAIIESVQPCNTRDASLFILHDLNRIDKHRTIPLLLGYENTRRIRLRFQESGQSYVPPVAALRSHVPIEEDAEFFRFDASHLPRNVQVQMETEFLSFLALAHIWPDKGLHVIDFLDRVLAYIETLLHQFDYIEKG